MKSSQSDVEAAKEAVTVAEKALDAAKEEEASFEMKVGQLKAIWEEAKALLDDIEKKLKSCSQELGALSKEKAKLTKKAESAEIEGKKMAIKITKFHSEHAKAEKFLKTIEDKHEVTYVDSGDEKDEDDDNTKTKGNTALQEGEDEVGRKRQRSTLPPHASSVETSTLFAEEINHGRGDAHTLPMPEFGGVNPGILPRPELLTPVMMNHNPTGQTYHHQPNRASASIGLGLWSQRILASAIIFSNRHHHHHHPFFLRNL